MAYAPCILQPTVNNLTDSSSSSNPSPLTSASSNIDDNQLSLASVCKLSIFAPLIKQRRPAIMNGVFIRTQSWRLSPLFRWAMHNPRRASGKPAKFDAGEWFTEILSDFRVRLETIYRHLVVAEMVALISAQVARCYALLEDTKRPWTCQTTLLATAAGCTGT